jgi:hypothetical protein
LDLAVANGWSKNELRRRVREASNDGVAVGVCRLRLDVDGAHQQRWRDAASSRGCTFEQWVIDVLDDAAARP